MTLSLRTQRSLQALVLAGLGLFLLQKIWTGTLYWYINQRFMLLLLLAAVGLLALAKLVLPGPRGPAAEAEAHDDGRDHAHAHGGGSAGAVWGILSWALPLALGLLVPARPLGTTAIANKGINANAPLAAGGGAPVQLDLASTERNVLDWVRAFNYASDPAAYAGEAAEVIGFVYHPEGLADGQFLVSRFAMTCCLADATAVGLLVNWPEAAGLINNTWVRVRGAMAVGSFAGRPTPLIVADSLEGVAEPEQPYLFP